MIDRYSTLNSAARFAEALELDFFPVLRRRRSREGGFPDLRDKNGNHYTAEPMLAEA